MSTRCQIGIYGDAKDPINGMAVLLYRHSDGYPGTADGKEYGVLPDIIPFLKSFTGQRGIGDVEYCGAQLLHHLMKAYDKVMEDCNKRTAKIFPNDKPDNTPRYTGHGICGDKQFHGDIEYYYAVYPTEVKVFEVCGDTPADWKKVKTVKFAKVPPRPPVSEVVLPGKNNLTADAII